MQEEPKLIDSNYCGAKWMFLRSYQVMEWEFGDPRTTIRNKSSMFSAQRWKKWPGSQISLMQKFRENNFRRNGNVSDPVVCLSDFWPKTLK